MFEAMKKNSPGSESITGSKWAKKAAKEKGDDDDEGELEDRNERRSGCRVSRGINGSIRVVKAPLKTFKKPKGRIMRMERLSDKANPLHATPPSSFLTIYCQKEGD